MSQRSLHSSLTLDRLAQKLFTAQSVKDGEITAAKQLDIDLFQVMLEAGQAICDWLETQCDKQSNILVLVGSGNNGGDGYVAASLLRQHGYEVTVGSTGIDKALVGDASKAQQMWLENSGSVDDAFTLDLEQYSVIVDAIFGTGLSRELSVDYVQLIQRVNGCQCLRLSVDIPSGINADTGRQMGGSFEAHATVTFVAKKAGTVTGQGRHYTGNLTFTPLSIGPAVADISKPIAYQVSYADFARLSSRKEDTHKGNSGKLLCIGGNKDMSGAIRLSAEAALRTGAGLLKVYCHKNSVSDVLQTKQELMATSQGLDELLDWADGIVLGPGLGQETWSQLTFNQVTSYLSKHSKPTIIDADGLNLLSKDSHKLNFNDLIFTPHSAEAARMMGVTPDEIEVDRYKSVRELQQKYGGSCILKGSGTIIQTPDKAFVCANGNPGMSTGGMGDVLSGVLGSLLAQGMKTSEAAVFGTCLHSSAADLVSEHGGQRGMIASDLFPYLRQLVN